MKTIMPNTPGPPRTPLTSFTSLSREASIYTLTLQEFQQAVNEPGKHFGSMNMEEFIKNIWTAEENQAISTAMLGTVDPVSTPGSTSLHRQSSASLPMNLSGKTVEEVWKEIHRSSNGDHSNAANSIQQKTATMGETTLEDFLTKVNSIASHNTEQVDGGHQGVVQTPQTIPPWSNLPVKNSLPKGKPLQLQPPPHQIQQHKQPVASSFLTRRLVAPATPPLRAPLPPHAASGVMPCSMVTNTILTGTAPITATVLGSDSLTQPLVAISDRKRPLDSHQDKIIQQRQKRMIQNRESAARSREKKQAYTVDLEKELADLKEENAKLLQKQNEIMEDRRNKLLEILVPVTTQVHKTTRHPLRRTKSSCW